MVPELVHVQSNHLKFGKITLSTYSKFCESTPNGHSIFSEWSLDSTQSAFAKL